MRWRKLGRVFNASGQHAWMQSHSQLPLAFPRRGEGLYRVLFASRDADNRSSVGYVDLDLRMPTQPVNLSSEPVLVPGPVGFFDEHGVYPASVVFDGERVMLYYIGWNRGARPPLFYASIGLAISHDGGETFQKYGRAPIMARSDHDPCLVTSPCVLKEGNTWRMWYVSGFRWEQVDQTLRSYYHIKYAESCNGMDWQREGHVCIDLREGESNIARPCVVKEQGCYHMWYSYNEGSGYRIGYARSSDGLSWNRLDDGVEMAGSPSDWDEPVKAYPWVFSAEGVRYMLYNGKDFGRDGFGLAVAADE